MIEHHDLEKLQEAERVLAESMREHNCQLIEQDGNNLRAIHNFHYMADFVFQTEDERNWIVHRIFSNKQILVQEVNGIAADVWTRNKKVKLPIDA